MSFLIMKGVSRSFKSVSSHDAQSIRLIGKLLTVLRGYRGSRISHENISRKIAFVEAVFAGFTFGNSLHFRWPKINHRQSKTNEQICRSNEWTCGQALVPSNTVMRSIELDVRSGSDAVHRRRVARDDLIDGRAPQDASRADR